MCKYKVEKIHTTSQFDINNWLNENVDDELHQVVSVSVDGWSKATTITIKEL